jgi:hypothetical protein
VPHAIVLLTLAAAILISTNAGFASESDLATIEDQCGKRLKLSPGGCACLRDKASELTEGQQAFIAAVVSKDKTTQVSLMQTLTVKELTDAGIFMTKTPSECSKGEQSDGKRSD